MKITKYIGALAFVAMLAACSNEEEQGINTLSNVVEVTANVGKIVFLHVVIQWAKQKKLYLCLMMAI